jgi:putative transposase
MVFTTKNREPFLNSLTLRETVFEHIKQNADEKDIWLDCVNGYQEHAHCLVALNKELTISKTAQLIKGESSFWINRNNLTENKFIWQDDFWAVGVSEKDVPSVRNYIQNQQIHHSKQSFEDEIGDFIKNHGWSFIRRS